MLTSGGGGGSSLSVPISLPVSSTFIEPALTEAETHLKKDLIVAESAVSSDTTHSVICFNTVVSAPCPAAHATIMPNLRLRNSSSPLRISSVGTPSVMINTSGFQSPLTSVVVLVTS